MGSVVLLVYGIGTEPLYHGVAQSAPRVGNFLGSVLSAREDDVQDGEHREDPQGHTSDEQAYWNLCPMDGLRHSVTSVALGDLSRGNEFGRARRWERLWLRSVILKGGNLDGERGGVNGLREVAVIRVLTVAVYHGVLLGLPSRRRRPPGGPIHIGHRAALGCNLRAPTYR